MQIINKSSLSCAQYHSSARKPTSTVCNKYYYGPRNINAIHKGDGCMWNTIVAYVVLTYSVPSMKFYAIWLWRVMHSDITRVNCYV